MKNATFPGWHSRLFGLTVEGDLSLRVPLPSGYGTADLVLSLSSYPLLKPGEAARPLYTSRIYAKDGVNLGSLYEEPDGALFHFPRAGDFRVRPDRIEAYLPEREGGLGELCFLGPVLSYWFELRGLPTLHASAVSVDGRAVVFAARHGGGKSGLAATMIQAGAALLADDLVVLEEVEDCWAVRPSYPMMRMWPDEVEHFLGRYED